MQTMYCEMKDDVGTRPKPRSFQKQLWTTLAALATLSIFVLTFAHLNLPASEQRYQQFLRSGRYRPDTSALSLRELYKKQSETFNGDQQQVVEMTRHAWRGYRKYAGWRDYLDVLSMKAGTVYRHDMALTTVDSLDTLFIMGLHDEFDEASAWVKANLSSTMFQDGTVSFFEVTIRSLGGLLSAFYLSGEQHFLDIAERLGKALQMAFTCGNYMPCRLTELKGPLSYDEPFLSEVSTLQLEFAYLARATEDDSFLLPVNHVNSIMVDLVRNRYPNGLIPVSMDWNRLQANPGSKISMGALGDSYYEYLLKQWLLGGKKDEQLREMYMTAVEGMQAELIGYSYPSNFAFVGAVFVTLGLDSAMEHLTCFVPGMLALGYSHGMPTSHLDLARELTETCVQMYLQSATHLAPEIMQFITEADADDVKSSYPELFVAPKHDYNLLRPETIESLMILHRVTGDEIYREHGRMIMAAFEQHSKVRKPLQFSVVRSRYPDDRQAVSRPIQLGLSRRLPQHRQRVFGPPKTKDGRMESFFLAETLKYLFLLFSDDDVLSLDDVVFNTEAHPFPRR